jgi:ACS family glucarate transporter-like MFS transporter
VFAASRIGAALAFPLMAWLLEERSWRETFYLLAIPGLLWAVVWYAFFRDGPAAVVSRATAALPLSEALRTKAFRLALFQYFATNFTTFLCLSWMNPYLKQRFSLSVADARCWWGRQRSGSPGIRWTGCTHRASGACPGRRLRSPGS